MAHRSIAEIDRDVAELKARLQAAHDERRAATRAKNDAIVAEFSAGRSDAEIAAERGVSESAIRGIRVREGRTISGRTAIRARIREAVGQGASA